MIDFSNKIWNKVFSNMPDEKYAKDVEIIAKLLISLSSHFDFKENTEGELYIVVKRSDDEAKRMLNLLLSEEYGKQAFFKIKEFVNMSSEATKNNSKKVLDASHTLEVCRYFRKKYGIIYNSNNKFASEKYEEDEIE